MAERKEHTEGGEEGAEEGRELGWGKGRYELQGQVGRLLGWMTLGAAVGLG